MEKGNTKLPTAMRTIGEVSEELRISQHVLRFWENRFTQLKPQKRRGRRYYTPEDIALLRKIRTLVQEQGHSIKEAQVRLEAEQVYKTAGLYDSGQNLPKETLENERERLKQLQEIYYGLCDLGARLKEVIESRKKRASCR